VVVMVFHRWPSAWLGSLLLARGAVAEPGKPAAPKPEMMNFKIKELTEEESMSEVMPSQFRCLACKAVIYQINQRLDVLQPKDPKTLEKSVLRQQTIRLAETLEDVCSVTTYKDYGVKDLAGDGGKVLNGPGIENEEVGMVQGGGKWPKRLSSMCKHMVEEEEDETTIAAHWRKGSLARKCDVDCGKTKAAKPSKAAKPAAKKTSKPKKASSDVVGPAPKTGLEELPKPPHVHQVVTAENISLILTPPTFQKFALILFFDTLPRSAHALACWEYGARTLKKEKLQDLRKTVLARYNSSSGDTWGYKFQGPLPRALLYRKGYKNPKKYDGPLDGPEDLVDWMKEEAANYMKDDPQRFPRAEL